MQEGLKKKSLQISVFRLDPRRSLTSPSAVISNRFTDRNKIDRTLLPCKKFWLGAAAVSYLTMSVGSVLIWFPSDNNKKRKEKSNIVQRLTAAERSGMFLMWHWGILRSRTTGAEGEAVCSFGQSFFFFFLVCLVLRLSRLQVLWLHSGDFAELLGVGQRALHLAPADGNHLSA